MTVKGEQCLLVLDIGEPRLSPAEQHHNNNNNNNNNDDNTERRPGLVCDGAGGIGGGGGGALWLRAGPPQGLMFSNSISRVLPPPGLTLQLSQG